MAFASVNQNADPIVSEATDGTPNLVDIPAPGFDLVDQFGRPVSLSDLRGPRAGTHVSGPCLYERLPGDRPGVPRGGVCSRSETAVESILSPSSPTSSTGRSRP